ncbi:MAG: hypothetical protein IJQ45_10315 [Clostridia bacterium]|nr:hypothetical protein [Clostridia bacterium]
MYLYQPCLLILSLCAWAFCDKNDGRRWRKILFPLGILAISWWELRFARITVYPAALLLLIPFLPLGRRFAAWAEVLTAALIGGFLSWKAADTWPLFAGMTLLSAVLLYIATIPLCRDGMDRRLACALGGLFYELFFCLKEYTLFAFCVIRLCSRESLSLTAAALCLAAIHEQMRQELNEREKRTVPIGN